MKKNPVFITLGAILLFNLATIMFKSADSDFGNLKIVQAEQENNLPKEKKLQPESEIRVYLSNMNSYLSPSTLIINFGREIAPFEIKEFKPDNELRLSPVIEGNWNWLDPSNLAFTPKTALTPDSVILIDLSQLKTREVLQEKSKLIEYKTPPFNASISKCQFVDIKEKPFSRKINFELISNYPFSEREFKLNTNLYLINKATASTQQNLNYSGTKSEISQKIELVSEKILRPSEDGELKFVVKPGAFSVIDKSLELTCNLPLTQKEFDTAAENNKLNASIVSRIGVPVEGNATSNPQNIGNKVIKPIILSFNEKQASGYVQTIKNLNPVETVITEGVQISPPIKGVWKNGNTDSSTINSGNIYFTPEEPLPSGTKFEIIINQNLFPELIFESLKTSVLTDIISAKYNAPELYTDPNNLSIKRASVSLEFNLPPKKGEVERLLQVSLSEPKGDKLDNNKRNLGFEVKYDPKIPNTVYIISEPLKILERKSLVNFYLPSGINSEYGGSASSESESRYLEIPSIDDYFNINQISSLNVVNVDGSVDRVLSIDTTTQLENINALTEKLSVFLLPNCSLTEQDSQSDTKKELPKSCKTHNYPQFLSPDEVFDDTLADSTPLQVTYVNSIKPQETTHLYKFQAPDDRKIFVKVLAGIKSKDGYIIKKDKRAVTEISTESRALKIQHSGSLLSLSGDKKLGIVARGVTKMEAELARVLPNNLNHLFATTDGDISNPEFNYYRFSSNNISEKYRFIEEFPEMQNGKPFYSTIDFGRFAKKGGLPKGLFILSIKEKTNQVEQANSDNESEEEDSSEEGTDYEEEEYEDNQYCDICKSYHPYGQHMSVKDSRLVLLTDIGIIVKDSENGEHSLYALSFRTRSPLEGAKVSIIGKNGLPILEGTTDKVGKVVFPKTDSYKDEKEPLAYVVTKEDDLSFLPFSKSQRQLNLSQFDTGGVYNSEEIDDLQAYLFSDRGIYRPGDIAHISTILRKRDWSQISKGLPLEVAVTDPRGQNIANYKLNFDKYGFEEVKFESDKNSLTGIYTFTLNIIKNKNDSKPLGTTTIKVENFQPDRLNVKSTIGETETDSKSSFGFVNSKNLSASVSVMNLFGTPAIGNNVKGTIWVNPWNGYLEKYRGFSFKKTNPETLPNTAQSLGEVLTNERGVAKFSLGLDKYAEPVYQVTFAGEGYEKDSGRSVLNSTTQLISNFDYLLGVKSNSLEYLNKDTERSVKLIAVDSFLKSVKFDSLKVKQLERYYVATLVKQPNGLLGYESTLKKNLVATKNLTLNEGENDLKLDTSKPGNFDIEIYDSNERLLNQFSYTVAGDGNISRSVEKNALLDIKLNKDEYQPEDTIEAQIIAPFTGTGLITIETDKVVEQKWFKTDSNATVQNIKLPVNLNGNAYFSVSFARSLDSKEIYMNPLSYGSVPFNISKSKFKNDLKIVTIPEITDQKTLKINYQLPTDSKLAIFAVDEGILQFARYKTPDPISGFFKKRALQVKTFQILDLLLPDYSIVKSLSSSGGDEDSGAGKFKNPFSRKNKPPVVFWNGIKELKAGSGEFEMSLPDYFSGSVKVFAVAVNDKKIGVATSTTKVKRPFVILPQMPYAVSPNDEFEVGALIANNVIGSSKDAIIKVKLKTSVENEKAIEFIGSSQNEVNIAEGSEKSIKFKVKANQKLMNVPLTIEVSGGKVAGNAIAGSDSANKIYTAVSTEEISIRPAQPFVTKITNNVIRPNSKEEFVDVPLTRVMFPEKSEIVASVSPSPASLIKGMIEFLKSYPYGCNEQTISSGFPTIVLGAEKDFGLNQNDIEKQVKAILKKLKLRQKYDGSFGYWDIVSPTDNFTSVYAGHFLIEARKRGFNIDEEVLSKSISYLGILTSENKTDLLNLLAQSYALYVLTLNGEVTTSKLKTVEDSLNSEWGDKWQKTVIRIFLAGSYKLLNLNDDAKRLLGELPKTWEDCSGANCYLPFPINHHGFYIGAYYMVATNLFPEIFTASENDPSNNNKNENLLKMGEELASRDNYTLTYSFGLLGMSGVIKNFSNLIKAQADNNDTATRFPVWIDNKLAAKETLVNPETSSAILSYKVPLNSKSVRFKKDNAFPIFYSVKESGFESVNLTKPTSSKIVVERKLLNEKGEEVTKIGLQDKLYINLTIKPQGDLTNVAIVDILPGGFEIDLAEEGLAARKSMVIPSSDVKSINGNTKISLYNNNPWNPDYIDIQEERVLFFGNFDGSAKTFTYRLKPLNVGKFNVPPEYAEGMYDNDIYYRGVNKMIEVVR